MIVEWGWPVVISCVLLLALPVLLEWRTKTGLAKPILIAGVRAVIQLTLVALIIAQAVQNLWLSVLVVFVMFVMAVVTSCKRIGLPPRQAPIAAISMFAGLAPVLVLTMATGAIPAKGIAIIPIAGVVMNNIMSVHTLNGRGSIRALQEQKELMEGYLALGIEPYRAAQQILHPRIKESLVPGIDSVKTSGIVTLPGAFLGVMLGGGSPLQAAMAQVVVLLGVLCAQTCTVLAQYHLISRGRLATPDVAPLLGRRDDPRGAHTLAE